MFKNFLSKLNQEPAALVGVVSAVVAGLVGFHVFAGVGLNTETGGLIVAAVEALLGVYLAVKAHQTVFASLSQAFKVLIALAVGFGAHVTDQQALLLVAVAGAAITAFQRTQIDPTAGSPSPEGWEPVEDAGEEWEPTEDGTVFSGPAD